MKKETFLQLHERLLKTGCFMRAHRLGPVYNGLCSVKFNDRHLSFDTTFDLFMPNDGEYRSAYWASDIDQNGDDKIYGPTRQNIILLCAAINNELSFFAPQSITNYSHEQQSRTRNLSRVRY